MKAWMIWVMAGALGMLGAMYTAWSDGSGAQKEFLDKCVGEFRAAGVSKAKSEASCQCVIEAGQARKDAGEELPSRNELAGILQECASEHGATTSPWS